MADLISRDEVIGKLKKAYFDKNLQEAKNDPCVIDAMTDWAIRQVKNTPSYYPWHTGAPTEEGVYVVVVKKYLVTENNRRVFLVEKAPSGFFLKDERQGYLEDSDILAWIEPFKEEDDGHEIQTL